MLQVQHYNHVHQECMGEETCPLCAGHTLKDCKAPTNQKNA